RAAGGRAPLARARRSVRGRPTHEGPARTSAGPSVQSPPRGDAPDRCRRGDPDAGLELSNVRIHRLENRLRAARFAPWEPPCLFFRLSAREGPPGGGPSCRSPPRRLRRRYRPGTGAEVDTGLGGERRDLRPEGADVLVTDARDRIAVMDVVDALLVPL